MVLSEQQKKDLVERLRAGREKKQGNQQVLPDTPSGLEKKKKSKKTPAPEPEPEPVAIVATKVEKPKRQPAKKAVEIKPDPEEYTIQTRDIPDSDSEPEPIDEPVQKQQERPMTIKEKRLNKNKPKYMAIKFYQEPNPELYKNIMSSIQPNAQSYTWDNHPAPVQKITEEEKQETARRIAEIKQKDDEQKMRDAIYKILG